jgi:hypothetical protein
MAYKKIEDKKINEFELVNNKENKQVFKVVVEDIEMSKDGFVLYGKNHKKIGVMNAKNEITIFPEYKKEIEQVEGISLDSKKIVIENAKKVKEQGTQEKKVQNEKSEEEKQQQYINQEEARKRAEKARLERSTSTRITHQDLMEDPNYKNVTSWTRIDDSEFTDSIDPSTKNGTLIDKNSIIVAEVNGKFKILAKTLGTNEIIDLTADAKENNTVKAHADSMDKNNENEIGRHCTITIPMIKNKEIIINKSTTGVIDLQQIDTSFGNDNKALPIKTDYMHPTNEELERAEAEQKGTYNRNAVMTEEEVEKEVDEKILENATKYKDENEMYDIRTDIMNEVRDGKNPTEEELDEKVKLEVEEFEKSEEADEPEIGEELEEPLEKEEEEERTLESDALERMHRRLFGKK